MQAQNACNLSHLGVQATQHNALDNWCVDGCYVCPALFITAPDLWAWPRLPVNSLACGSTEAQLVHPTSLTNLCAASYHSLWLVKAVYSFRQASVLFLAPDVTTVHRPQVCYHVDSTWIMPPNTGAPGGINHIKYFYFFNMWTQFHQWALTIIFCPPPPPPPPPPPHTHTHGVSTEAGGDLREKTHTHSFSPSRDWERRDTHTHTGTVEGGKRGAGGGGGGGGVQGTNTCCRILTHAAEYRDFFCSHIPYACQFWH